MAFLGGDSQSTSSLVSAIDFSPVIQFGKDQSAKQDKVSRQDATVSPRLDGSMGLSVGVGVGGAGTGGAVSRQQQEDMQPKQTGGMPTLAGNKNTLYYLIGGIALVGVAYSFSKKKKKK